MIPKILIPQKILIFLKTPKNIEIKNFEPPKMGCAYVYMKISEYPPGVDIAFTTQKGLSVCLKEHVCSLGWIPYSKFSS